MALGKTHDKINLIIGASLTGLIYGLGLHLFACLSFSIGFLISTLFFSPDTDIRPKARTGIWGTFLYPYSVLFRHRGLSHHPILGTLTRIAYGLLVSAIAIFVIQRMGYLQFDVNDYFSFVWQFIVHFDYKELTYRVFIWFFIGLFMADFGHIMVDRVSSFLKKLNPFS